MDIKLKLPTAIDLDGNSAVGWNNLFEAIPDAMIVTKQATGQILQANPACEIVYGYKPEEMLGKTTVELGIFKNTTKRNEILQELVAIDFFMELQYHDKTNSPRFGLFSGKKVTAFGQDAFLIIARDITDRKEIETSLERANDRFDLLANVSNIIPWETNIHQELTYIGPAIKRWGLNPKNLLGKTLYIALSFENKSELSQSLCDIAEGKTDSYTECHLVNIDGLKLDMELKALPIRNAFGMVTGIAGMMQDISRFVNTERELRDLASRDPITNLYNRRGFCLKLESHLKSFRKSDHNLLVLYIDLDNFKPVNDEFGHDVGDELLVSVARSLENTLRDSDVVARIGGDEFIALLVNTHCQYAEAVCKRVLYDFSKIAVNGSKITGVQASLGLVVAGNESAEEVIKRADSAMYEAKKQGKNRYFIEK